MQKHTVLSPILFALCLSPLPLLAEVGDSLVNPEITISDCQGKVRAQAVLQDGSESKLVRVSLSQGVAFPSALMLTKGSENGSAVVVSDVAKGEAYFKDVGAGSYMVCDEGKSSVIDSVSFVSSDSSEGSVIAAVGGALVAGGGAVALAVGGSSGGSNEATTNTVLKQPVEVVPVAGAQRPTGPATSSRDCLNSDRVRPISPFN
jgi:hypothetical protein